MMYQTVIVPVLNAGRRSTLLPGFLLILSLAAVAQSPSSPVQPVSTPPSESATTPNVVDAVSLDLVVHDKRRKQVLDLKPGDLVVTDNDSPVQLTSLRLVKGDSGRDHLVTLLFDPFAGAGAKEVRNTANKVLKALPSHGYKVAVLDLRGRLRVLQNFTEDRNQTERTLKVETESRAVTLESTHSRDVSITTDPAEAERQKSASAAEKDIVAIVRTGADASGHHVDITSRPLSAALLAALQNYRKVIQEQHAKPNLAGLMAIIRAQQQLSGRKAILYFTRNQPMDSNAKQMLKKLAAAATHAGVTIYTIDMDALNESGQYQLDNAMMNGGAAFNSTPVSVNPMAAPQAPMQQRGAGPIGGPGGNWGTQQTIQAMTDFARNGSPRGNPFADVVSPMAELSTATGGLYIDAQNSLKKPLRTMVEDLNTYYEASYVPPLKEYDGSFRSISIKPVRANLRVQSQTGYFALPPGADGSIRPFEAPLLKALSAPSLPADLTFHAAVLRFGNLPDGNANTVAVAVPLETLDTRRDTHTSLYSAHVSLVAQIRDHNGVVVEHFAEDATRRGALESLTHDKASSVELTRHFMATPGKYTLEVAALDQNSGRMGARRMEFEIPADAPPPGLSDIVLVRKLAAVREDDDDPLEPLRYQNSNVTPDVSGQLAENVKGISMFLILHPDPAVKELPTLEMQVVHNGVAGRRMPLPLHIPSDASSVPYLASFGSSPLSPGSYEVTAYLNQGGKTGSQSLKFSVAGEAARSMPDRDAAAQGAITGGQESDAIVAGKLTITVPSSPIPPLAESEGRALIEAARQRAISYHESLPNFMVIEVINRSVDPSGMGNWRLKDTILELLRYRDKQESRTTLQVNGQPTSTSHEGMKGALSTGEFGGVLRSVFSPSANSQFRWKETDELNGGSVQVFDYTVKREHSLFSVVGTDGRQMIAAFHGQVFIDPSTHSVRRVTIHADDLPASFSTHASSIAVDYDYVSINDHDYLMPVSAEMRLMMGRHRAVLNTIEFRDYRRFGSDMRILNYTPVDQTTAPK